MERLDELLNFLFRSIKGRLVLIGCTIFIACMCSGCFLFTCPACFCQTFGCDICADCWMECNKGCGGSSSSSSSSGCSACGGSGCSACGACSSCGGSGCSSCKEKEDPTTTIYIYYIAVDSEGNYIERYGSSYYDIKIKDLGDLKSVPYWDSTSSSAYFTCEAAYDSYDEETNTFGDLIAGSDGVMNDKKAFKNGLRQVYVKMVENAAIGEEYIVHFDLSEYSSIEIEPLTLVVGSPIKGFPAANTMPVLEDGRRLKYWTSRGYEVKVNNGDIFHPYKMYLTDIDSILRAVYGDVSYKLEVYYAGIGEDVKRYEKELEYGSTLENALKDIKYDRYDNMMFVGWAFSRENRDNKIVDLSQREALQHRITSNMTLYAVYVEGFSICLHYTEGPNKDETFFENVYEGQVFDLGTCESKQGPYMFEGWYTDPEFTAASRVSGTLTASLSMIKDYYANWTEVKNNKITYFVRTKVSHTYSEYKSINYEYSSDNNLPLEMLTDVDFIPTGYSFDGWRDGDFDDKIPVITELPKGTFGLKQLYAAYSPRRFDMRLFTDGGNLSGLPYANGYYTTNIYYDQQIKLPVPEKEGSKFAGWYVRGTGGARFTDDTGAMLEPYNTVGGIALEAKWEARSYTVTFKNGDTVVSQSTVEYGKPVPAKPSDPIPQPGYKFIKWVDSSDKEYNSERTIIMDTTFRAVFDPAEYTITFRLSGGATFTDGSTEKTIKVKYGDTNISLLEPAEDPDYMFNGWKIKGTSDADIIGSDNKILKYDYTDNIELEAVITWFV